MEDFIAPNVVTARVTQVEKLYNHKHFMKVALSLNFSRAFLRAEREKARALVREELEDLNSR